MNNFLFYLAATLPSAPDVPKGNLSTNTIAIVIRIALGIAGAIAVLIITISAFRYVVSQGDPQSIAKAKNGIINALIGLVICILGIAIVTFVIARI